MQYLNKSHQEYEEGHCPSVTDNKEGKAHNLNERFMKKLTKEIIERLEYVDGDGVEFEVYRDTKTNKHYSVQIEIVRHFKFAEEVSGNSFVDLDNIIDW